MIVRQLQKIHIKLFVSGRIPEMTEHIVEITQMIIISKCSLLFVTITLYLRFSLTASKQSREIHIID